MKKNKAVIALGIIFGLSLGVVAYLYMVLGIAFALTGKELMAYAWYVFAGLAVATVVTSCFAIKNVIVARVGLTISVIFSAAVHIYSLIDFIKMDALEGTSVMLFAVLFGTLLFGLIAMILAYKSKSKAKEEPQPLTEE